MESSQTMSLSSTGDLVPQCAAPVTADDVCCVWECVLCGCSGTREDGPGFSEPPTSLFGRILCDPTVILINKLAAVAGCSAESISSRGSVLCFTCSSRISQLHVLEVQIDRERRALCELYEGSVGRSSNHNVPAADGGLLLANGVQVRGLVSPQLTADVTATASVVIGASRPLRRARRTHQTSSQRRYECKVCGKRFVAYSHRVEHMLIHLNETPWSCDACTKRFRTKSALTAHGRTHAPEPCPASGAAPVGQHTCPHCDRQLGDAVALRRHVRRHVVGRQLTCATCSRRFSRRHELTLHARQHSGERPHVCRQCGASFVNGSRLNRHRLVHVDKRHACSCGRRFRRRYDLTRHAADCAGAADGAAMGCQQLLTTQQLPAQQLAYLPTSAAAATATLVMSDHHQLLYEVTSLPSRDHTDLTSLTSVDVVTSLTAVATDTDTPIL